VYPFVAGWRCKGIGVQAVTIVQLRNMERSTIAVIAPCHNEGEVVIRFLERLGEVLAELPYHSLVVVVDDGSTDDTLQQLKDHRPGPANMELRVLSLPYNMGHQEAIHQGLLHASTTAAEHFIVLDSDGEDDPATIPAMLQERDVPIVLVARGSRSASPGFRLGLTLYRLFFRLVTGRPMQFGNFSMIDRRVLQVVLDRSFVHYAAFLSRRTAEQRILVRDRLPRLGGRSKMDLKALSIHAFRSLVECSEEVLTFFLRAFLWLAVVFLGSALVIIGIKLFTALAIPGWASILSATLFNAVLLCLGFFSIGLLLVNGMHRRERAGRHFYTLHDQDN
jgi:polyisoprenyl-phosphate glycosyltransferase